jgi:Peptidase S24-like
VTPDLASGVRLALARVVVERGRQAKLAIRGVSMLPLLREPMTIGVEALRRPARVGDVLVFRAGDAYVAHRVLRRSGGSYVTSGDAVPDVVEHVDSGDVLGRVTAVWSDAYPGAARIDTPFHHLRGVLYARARPARLVLRRVIGRALRLFRLKGNR